MLFVFCGSLFHALVLHEYSLVTLVKSVENDMENTHSVKNNMAFEPFPAIKVEFYQIKCSISYRDNEKQTKIIYRARLIFFRFS